MLTRLKNRLLKAGSDSFILLEAFRLQAAAHGVWMRLSNGEISLMRGRRKVILSARDAMSVPFVVHMWDLFFDTLEGETREGRTVLDFSRPGLHRYRRSGLSFYVPALAEDDCMDAYTDCYFPQPGDVVWDVGAYAGMTTYFFAQMVGPGGKVYAFEPDEINYEFLLRNLKMHQLENVIPVKAALSDKSGTAEFRTDGTMSAGLCDFLYAPTGSGSSLVETLALKDACEQFGCVPNYIKLDIEGAEVGVVRGALDFLTTHPIHLSIESNHRVEGEFTSGRLEELLARANYRAWSSKSYGQLFTWAEPPESLWVEKAARRDTAA
jgi:FkbM family methyltransferase